MLHKKIEYHFLFATTLASGLTELEYMVAVKPDLILCTIYMAPHAWLPTKCIEILTIPRSQQCCYVHVSMQVNSLQ